MSNDNDAFAAAEIGTYLAGELEERTPEYVREFAGLVDDRRTLRLLNYYCSLWEDEDEDFLDTFIGREILRSAATRTVDDAVRAGNVSQMKRTTGLTNQSKQDGQDFYGRVCRDYLADEGRIGCVFGPPNSGKTATTIDVARAWQVRTGGALIGNADWGGFDEKVTTDREMLEAMASVEGPVLAVLDEIAQDLSGFGEGVTDAEAFSDALLLVRKREQDHGPYPKKGRVLLISQTRTKTAKPLREIASFGVQKPSVGDKGRATLLESDADDDSFHEADAGEYKGLSDTAADYGEYDPAPFRPVLADDGDEDEDDGADVDDVRRDVHIRTAIKAVKPWSDDEGMSYKQVAEYEDLVPYSDSWVGDRCREWEQGEHREIVPDPTDESD